MGMFDTIYYNSEQYQTTDIDEPHLHTYVITATGRLMRVEWGLRQDPAYIGRRMRQFKTGETDMDYHGVIRATQDFGKKAYRFKFTDGVLVSVEEIKDVDV